MEIGVNSRGLLRIKPRPMERAASALNHYCTSLQPGVSCSEVVFLAMDRILHGSGLCEYKLQDTISFPELLVLPGSII